MNKIVTIGKTIFFKKVHCIKNCREEQRLFVGLVALKVGVQIPPLQQLQIIAGKVAQPRSANQFK